MTGGKWSVSETSTNVDLRAGKIMHNTFLKRRAEPPVSVATEQSGEGGGEESGGVGVRCSHKFAIMQMPGRSLASARPSPTPVAYFTAASWSTEPRQSV